jgi:hypothetical protein
MNKLSIATELAVFKRDKNVCQGCQRVLPTKYDVEPRYRAAEPGTRRNPELNFLVVDHIRGRSNALENLQSLCWSCNCGKGGRSMNSFRLTLVVNQLGNSVFYYPSLAKLIGAGESIFLSQLIHWTPRGRGIRGDEWIHKSVAEIALQTGFDFKVQSQIRKRLIDLGLVEEAFDEKSRFCTSGWRLKACWNWLEAVLMSPCDATRSGGLVVRS